MGCSKSSSKREVLQQYNPTSRNKENIEQQPNFTPKTTGKKKKKKNNNNKKKISRRKEIMKIRAEINEKEMKEVIVKINKIKAGSLR